MTCTTAMRHQVCFISLIPLLTTGCGSSLGLRVAVELREPVAVNLQPLYADLDQFGFTFPIERDAIVLYDPASSLHVVTAPNSSKIGREFQFTVNIGEAMEGAVAKTIGRAFTHVSRRRSISDTDAFIFQPVIHSAKWWCTNQPYEIGVPENGHETFEIDMSILLRHAPNGLISNWRTIRRASSNKNTGLMSENLAGAGQDAVRDGIAECLRQIFSDPPVVLALAIHQSPAKKHARSSAHKQPNWRVLPKSDKISTMAVIDFSVSVGKENGLGKSLGDICRDTLVQSGHFRVLDRNNMQDLLGEQDFAAVVRCDETKCLVQYGKLLHAQRMIHGRVSPLEDSFLVYLSMVDVNTSRLVSTWTSVYSKRDDLRQMIIDGTYQLVVSDAVRNASP